MNFLQRLTCLKWQLVWHRKHFFIWMAFLVGTVFLILSNSFYMENSYNAARPLYSIQYEARRLLKYITHRHYKCHHMLFGQHLNFSWWTVCGDDKEIFARNSKKIGYSIGVTADYKLESMLAQKNSFQIFAITPQLQRVPDGSLTDITHVPFVVVANDPADVMRNSFTHRTINDIMKEFVHAHLHLLRIINIEEEESQPYEVLEFAIKDNLLLRVNELHLVIHFDKLDEDALFRWYRVLHALFYTQGLRLYNSAASDPLCMEVTVFESCSYALSFVRHPGPAAFILYPPADAGIKDMEYERLLDYIHVYKVCHSVTCQTLLQNSNNIIASYRSASLDSRRPCLLHSESKKEHLLFNWSTGLWDSLSWRRGQLVIGNLSSYPSVMSMDTFNADLSILTHLLNGDLPQNVTWVRLNAVSSPSQSQGLQSDVFRLWYSELRRLESRGFELVASHAVDLKNFGITQNAGFTLLCRKSAYMIRKRPSEPNPSAKCYETADGQPRDSRS